MPLAADAFYLIDHRLLAFVMVALLLAACEIGYRAGLARADAPDTLRTLMSGIGGAMLGLLGLLLGFALSMAIARWDARRDVIIAEANAIGTLSLRAGLLEEPLRDQLREALGAYTEVRVVLGGSRDEPEELRRAMKAFKKRLKLSRLDDESSLGHGPMSGGKSSGIVAIVPPNQYPKAVWDELVARGRLKYVGQGLYELANS